MSGREALLPDILFLKDWFTFGKEASCDPIFFPIFLGNGTPAYGHHHF